MRIYVNVKKAGSRRNALDRVPYDTELTDCSLRDLLAFLVGEEVRRFNQRSEKPDLLRYLTAEDLEAAADAGKVDFHAVYRDRKADPDQALKTALEAYADGLVRVFRNDRELTDLDQPLTLREGDVLTLIRLTFLTGRMW